MNLRASMLRSEAKFELPICREKPSAVIEHQREQKVLSQGVSGSHHSILVSGLGLVSACAAAFNSCQLVGGCTFACSKRSFR